jgi:nucleotide-binding universal stress UspA family protein
MALTLLRVVDPINPAPLLRDEAGARLRLAGRRGEAARYLDAVRRRLERRGIPARIVVRAGDPAQEILDYARSREMDLIAMSTHGRTGLRRAVFGSVAEAVGRQALVPVLLVRSQPGRKTPSRAR